MSDPEVPDADALEQRQARDVDAEEAVRGESPPEPASDVEAPEADAIEQAQEAAPDDEDEDRR